jgi:group I intron endonuclease
LTTKIAGVYALTNTITNRRYVGSTKDLSNRRASHFWQMRANRHKNRLIQADFDQHGADSFRFDVLEYAPCPDLRAIEQAHIDSGDFAYNLAPKAAGGGAQNEQTPARMSRAHTGKRHSAATIAKIKARPAEKSGAFIGYFITPAGRFASSHQAADAMGGVLNFTTIRRWCKNPNKAVCAASYRKSAYLQTMGERVIGCTFAELGFGFEPAG